MAVSGPLKAKVPEASLPPLTYFSDNTFGYDVRYRIVSEDKNRFSPYSPVYRVRPNYEFQKPPGVAQSDLEILTAGPYVNLVWDPITIVDRISGQTIRQALEYDIFLQWGKGETNPFPVWIYEERVEGTQIGFRYPTQYQLTNGATEVAKPNRLSAEVYLRSSNPSRENVNLLLYRLFDVAV